MNYLDKLELIKKTIKEHNITAYEIGKETKLSSVGVQKIINGESKKPNALTVDKIFEYLHTNVVGVNVKNETEKQAVEEPQLQYNNPHELINSYKKQIFLFEKNMHLYEENANLYRENAGFLREKVACLTSKMQS